MRQDVLPYVGTCHTCQLNKSRSGKPSGLLHPFEVPENSWECVNMDFVTGLPSSVSGLDAILMMVDKRTKMAHFAACKTTCDVEPLRRCSRHLNCRCTELCACMGCPSRSLRTEDPNSQASSQKQCCASWGQGKRSRLPTTLKQMARQNV